MVVGPFGPCPKGPARPLRASLRTCVLAEPALQGRDLEPGIPPRGRIVPLRRG